MLDDIDYWRDAPLWDPQSIAQATQDLVSSIWRREAHDGSMQVRQPLQPQDQDGRGDCARSSATAPRKKKVIMCHGMFDVVHPGHMRHLLYAKSKADILIASLTADAPHREGATIRPYVPQELRALNLAALEIVDYVVIDPNRRRSKNIGADPARLFRQGLRVPGERPASAKTQEEIDVIEAYGGEIIFTPGDIVYSSSSQLIEAAPPRIAHRKADDADGERDDLDLRRPARARSTSSSGVRVHVVGDTIVDSYTYCTHDRRQDQDADDERAASSKQDRLRRRRRHRRQASAGGRRRGDLLDRARRRPAEGLRARRI